MTRAEAAGVNVRRFLDPRVASQIEQIDLRARLVVEGFLTGLHRSPFHGFSVEFAEHRPYSPGDPIRHLDWKVFAKQDRYYIKRFHEETNLRAYLLVDESASMGFTRGGRPSKLAYASSLAAALSYLMLGQQDAVGLLLFAERIERYVPPRSVKSHLHQLLLELARAEARSGTRVGSCLTSLAERVKRRGLVMVFSDLLDEPEAVLAGLKAFRHRNHEVVVFHVLDPDERRFPFHEPVEIEDMESSERLVTHGWEVAREYRRRVEEWCGRLQRECRERLIDYVPLDTATPFDVALIRYLEKRARLH
ncbi:MAG TPA: DUF58 domain-containing protein [Candidatus Saccharimonadales bacterium]|nr:DUF58 domain-containing protein [Candidatus Saccharimonadales bacterium]